jgi:hypothetical protein
MPSGEVYEGDFSEGKRIGTAVIQFPNGSKYEGECEDGVPYGEGALPSYQIMEGSYQIMEGSYQIMEGSYQIMEGFGNLLGNRIEIRGSVITLNVRTNCAGTMLFADGKSSYKGSWKLGKRHGKGIMLSVVGGETIVVVRARAYVSLTFTDTSNINKFTRIHVYRQENAIGRSPSQIIEQMLTPHLLITNRTQCGNVTAWLRMS